jgi:hypothetical protein
VAFPTTLESTNGVSPDQSRMVELDFWEYSFARITL